VVERDTLDMRVLAGEAIPEAELKAVLSGDSLPADDLLYLYAERLLHHALDARDAEAALLVARLMEANPNLDTALQTILNTSLDTQPDAVYAFIRARLSDKLEPRWLPLLQTAAVTSLRVAIGEGDTETIVQWLTLIAREPASYELGEVLHDGILAAQERAHENGDLGRQLIVLAAKRAPAALDILLADPALIAMLPDNVGRTLRDLDGDALALLQNRGAELFTVAMVRAAHARNSTMFTPPCVATIWELYANPQTPNSLPPHYQVAQIIHLWAAEGISYLTPDATQTLFTSMLTDKQTELVTEIIHHSDNREQFFPLLPLALKNARRPPETAVDLMGKLITAGDAQPQQAADLYAAMAADLEWGEEAFPLLEQFVRTIQQHPMVTADADVLWNLLDVASEKKDDLMAKVVVKRLVVELEKIEEDMPLAENLRQMRVQVQWSETAAACMTSWWRVFIRRQNFARLQRLEKALDGRRGLDEERSILHTLIAVRKMIGQKTLSTFADNIRIAYAVLEDLAESYDPSAKRPANLDLPTVREELDTRSEQLSMQERQILANNLKELAQLIADMAENRTKANLMRRGDDVDRDLISGEQPPHGAVDTMKWLAGYWGGAQNNAANEK
jgi:hypothetical protein